MGFWDTKGSGTGKIIGFLLSLGDDSELGLMI
jgi:hypothetical protein